MGWSEWKPFGGSNGGATTYDLGEVTSTVDVKSLIEDGTLPSSIDYTKLTAENFGIYSISCAKFNTSQQGASTMAFARADANAVDLSYTYDNTTGVLTLSGNQITIKLQNVGYGTVYSKTQTLTCKVYLIC